MNALLYIYIVSKGSSENKQQAQQFILLCLFCFCLLCNGLEIGGAVLAIAGPSGMNVVVFPASYGQDCETGASIVMISSLGSILTVPVLYALVQNFF